MGVPALFRWLSKKYPKIISPVVEELPQEYENGDGTKTKVPVDASKPNPNGEEMDNLYLDMNGIVHPCSHPEDRPPPATEEEMMIAIFEYTDRVVNMVRPRKLLMIAVDGVAPRAKMNQQRSRRFRSAQEAAEKDAAAAEYHAMMAAQGHTQEGDSAGEAKKTWDSNAITPGTPFMNLLAASLRYWVGYKLSTDPAWENLKVIISDATVPGEGEHKIMNFVRSQRSSPGHDPNTRHVMYGLDADLIMLGLATHEPHFRILREDVFANDTKPGHCRKCNQPGHIASQCQGAAAPKPGQEAIEKPLKPFIWLHVGILREYLAIEMHPPSQNFAFDLERALDDWVFMCFFVGNDFLPHLPSLDIREDGIDTLIAIWRDNSSVMGGYVTKDGHVDLVRAQIILDGLAQQEAAIFKRRRETDLKKEAAAKRREQQDKRNSNKRPRLPDHNIEENGVRRGPRGGMIRGELPPDPNALPTFAPSDAQTRNDPRYAKTTLTHADIVGGKTNQENKSAAAALKEQMKKQVKGSSSDEQKAEVDALMREAGTDGGPGTALGKRTRSMIDDAADEATSDPSTPGRNTPIKEIVDRAGGGTSGQLGGNSQGVETMPEDTVKLWEDGYEERYYEQKFHVAPDDIEFRNKVARSYVEGLSWVLLYYFQGCPSWTWYYPHHYAPFAANFKDMEKQTVNFEKGKPFRPYEQLMGVMPAASNHTIPPAFHSLMTDDDSSIKEFYPTDFEVDLNGKKFAWQGVALLPFIDEKRLLEAMGTKYPLLTEDEHRRNEVGKEALIFSNRHPLNHAVNLNFYSKKEGVPRLKLDTTKSHGLSGKVSKDDDYVPFSELRFPLPSTQDQYTSLEENGSVTVSYHMPVLSTVHKSMLLPNVKFNEPVLDYHDIQATRDQASRTGRKFGGVMLTNDGGRSDGRRINYAARDGGYRNGGGYREGSRHNGESSERGGDPLANLPPHLAAQAAQHGFLPNSMPPLPPGFPSGNSQGTPPMPMGYPPRHGQGATAQSYDSLRHSQHGNGYGSRDGYHGSGNYSGGRGNGYGGGYGGDRYGGGSGYQNGGYSNGGYSNGGYQNGRGGGGRRY